MEDSFVIEIDFEGRKYSFETRLATVGYTHKFCVVINDLEVIYEPDEERNYRALLNETDQGKVKDLDKELIKLVGEKIEASRQSSNKDDAGR